jgi:hydroxymethylbilane synthase
VKARVLSFASVDAPLPRAQTQAVIDRIQEVLPRVTCQLNVLPSPVSAAERDAEVFVAMSRGEIDYLESVLQQEQARLVVVEAADMVLPLPDDLDILCVPDRTAPFDAYLNRQGLIMDDMEPGCAIGVLSMRSRSQMAALWPELKFQILRGGVDKAMETHMHRSEIDGLIVPAAVTEHLGIQGVVAEIYAPDFILPSPGQGILAVIGRAADTEARELLAPLHSTDTAIELAAEQAFCRRMISDQDLPVGALAKVEHGEVAIVGATGAALNRIMVNGATDEAEAVGSGLAQQILSSGESFADLLEADFPDGLPDDPDDPMATDEDAVILGDFDRDDDDGDVDDLEDLEERERMRALEDMAGVRAERDDAGDEDDDEDEDYD